MIPQESRSDARIMGIAHDLNNVLSTIMGYAEMLIEDLERESPLSEHTAKILMAVNRAKSLTNQILYPDNLSISGGIITDAGAVLYETIGFLKAVMPSEIKLVYDIPDKQFIVTADPTQIFRIFLNLMTNALKSMKDKGGVLYIGIQESNGHIIHGSFSNDQIADKYIVVTFRDTGTGIDPVALDKIFDPYYSKWEKDTGTGMGLSVVRDIVKSLGGNITVTSDIDKGSVFNVHLPLIEIKDIST